MKVHVCNITHANGDRLRIVAIRTNRRAMLADFDCMVIHQARGEAARVVAEFRIDDFRAMGAEGLFAHILEQAAMQNAGKITDEDNGMPVPMPEVSRAEWDRRGREYLAMAKECFQRAGVGGPELIEPAAGPGLFELRKP